MKEKSMTIAPKGKSDFIKHLEKCKKETETWPKWKRESIQAVKAK